MIFSRLYAFLIAIALDRRLVGPGLYVIYVVRRSHDLAKFKRLQLH